MFIDFSFYLLLAVLLMAVAVAIWRLGRRRWWPDAQTPALIVYAGELLPILLLVFLLRSFVIEPFRIPSGSMLPNLRDGDLILVTKYNYGIRLPLLNRQIIATGKPQRGDPLVFYHPDKPELHYIKRVVGLPGDHLAIKGGRVLINGEPLVRGAAEAEADEAAKQAVAEARRQMRELDPKRFRRQEFTVETAPEGTRWITVHERGALEFDSEVQVPPGHYFVLGDNRDRSNDSRFWGFVPDHHIAGKARLIWLHLGWRFWSRNGAIDPIEPLEPSVAAHSGQDH